LILNLADDELVGLVVLENVITEAKIFTFWQPEHAACSMEHGARRMLNGSESMVNFTDMAAAIAHRNWKVLSLRRT